MTLDVDIYKYLKRYNQIHSKELHLFGSRRECRKALDLQDISISLMNDIIALIYPDKEKDGTRTRIKYTAAELLEVWL